MSCDDVAIRVRGVAKHYLLFKRPEDRLKESIIPRVRRLAGLPVTHYYRDFAALRNVSLDVRRGETVGIVGRNGSGKSTLLQVICGTLRPTQGSVEVHGRIAALLELGAGFNPEFTGRENVYLNGAILGLERAEIDRRFDAIARFADIGQFIELPVKTYSSGMYVRLAFATAINVDPDILVVDEALAVGDEAFRRKCYARIEEIQARGGTILFVSHSAATIVQVCSRAVLIDAGELILEGTPKTVVGQYQRLVNATPHAAPAIRSAIVAMDAAEVPAAKVAAAKPAPKKAARDRMRPAADPVASDADFYDPGLKPQSTVRLEERGARIRDARILTLDGAQVNVLQMGRRYVFEFAVDFSADASRVGFGMVIKTVDGRAVSGAQTNRARALRIAHVVQGSWIKVRYEFSNLLLPGTYFVSCGVRGVLGGAEEIVLNRVADVIMCRVAPESGLMATGLVDLDILPEVVVSRTSIDESAAGGGRP